MLRVRVPLVAALIVLGITVVAWLRITGSYTGRVEKQVEDQVARAQLGLAQASRIAGVDVMAQAAQLAREDAFVQVFTKSTDAERNQAAFIECDVRRASLERDGRKPAII